MTPIRIVYSLLLCAVISGMAAYQVYREIFWWFEPEKTFLRLQYAGGQLHRIEDVVFLPENQVLLLMRLRFMLPPKSTLSCVFSSKITTPVMGVDTWADRAAIRCEIPSHFFVSPDSVNIRTHTNNLIFMSLQKKGSRPSKWNHMVYESAVTETEVILFAKGINTRQGINAAPETLRCVYSNTVETAVTISAQEIFRCAHPPQHLQSQLSGGKISLKTLPASRIMPSAAYYNPHIPESKDPESKLLCACTMVFNAAKFLKEWTIYHSHLGVEEFFIYDNNSDDNLEQVTESLSGYNLSRRPWPWPKTQEAAFAHCSLAAANKCKWVMFTDVDEFVFSRGWLQDPSASSNALKIMLVNKTSSSSTDERNMVGQVSMKCRNFGASNLKEHPAAGVTQGYSCRERAERRHKSIVLLQAASPSLLNAVHHFELKPGYKTIGIKSSEAVINHYKYQAWSEFREKFRRRASAYVVDWKQAGKNRASQDRAPGLGCEAVRPPDWENKFCQVNDTSLRQFTAKVFSVKNGSLSLMRWQL